MAKKKVIVSTKRQKELILRALTDPKFRKMLETTPHKALGKRRLSAQTAREVGFILGTVKAINAQIAALADHLLCANGGPCGIA